MADFQPTRRLKGVVSNDPFGYRATSSRNAQRHQIGMAGEIIPESRATSAGISSPVGGEALIADVPVLDPELEGSTQAVIQGSRERRSLCPLADLCR